MATASVTNTLVNGSTPLAAIWNTNYQDLVDFLNNSVVHRDGSKSVTGDLDFGGNAITDVDLSDMIAAGEQYTSTTLSASAGVYQDMHGSSEITIPSTGTYLLIASGFIEASIAADIDYTIALRRDSDDAVFASTVLKIKGTLGSAWKEQWMLHDGANTPSAGDVVKLSVQRDVASGTSLFRQYSISAIRVS